MYILLFHSPLLKSFIYNKVKASQILHGTTIPAARTKNKVNTISIHLIRKKFPFFQIIYYLPTRKMKNEEIPLSKTFLSRQLGMLNVWHLLFVNVSRKLCTINGSGLSSVTHLFQNMLSRAHRAICIICHAFSYFKADF